MSTRIIAIGVLAALAMARPAAAQTPTPAAAAATQPATAGAEVPQPVLDRLNAQFALADELFAKGLTSEAMQSIAEAMKKVLEIGRAALRDHAAAPNLYLVQARMLQAASALQQITGEKEHDKTVMEMAHAILGSQAPLDLKVQADGLVTRAALRDAKGATPAEQTDQIRKFVQRFAGTGAAVQAIYYALSMNMELSPTDGKPATTPAAGTPSAYADLRNELTDKLEKDYAGDPSAVRLLRALGRTPDLGKPFEAELTTLDGRKLVLPGDLLGKVVVIDFWASWCMPCVAAMPRMKELHQKYRDRGVQFVGISLDRTERAARAFVKEHQVEWIITYDGPAAATQPATAPGAATRPATGAAATAATAPPEPREHAAAVKYGIRTIPTLWVVGKDGRVAAINVEESQLEAAIEAALKAPAAKNGD